MNRNMKYCVGYQQGATLVVALILLLVMAMMASTALQSNVLQSRMAANMQDETIAFEAAESVLLYSEGWLSKQTALPDLILYDDWSAGSSEFVFDGRTSSKLKKQLEDTSLVSGWESRAKQVTFFDANAAVSSKLHAQPRVSLELTDFDLDNKKVTGSYASGGSTALFRQLSRNTGATGDSEVILIAEYRKRFEY